MKKSSYLALLVLACECLYGCASNPKSTPTDTELPLTIIPTTAPEIVSTATATPDIPENLMDLIPLFDVYERKVIEVHRSDDGRWLISEFSLSREISSRTYVYSGIEVDDRFGSRDRIVFENVQRDGIGISHPEVLQYGSRPNRVYLVNSLSGDGCFATAFQGFLSFDLLTGESSQIGPDYFRELAISPDQNFLAYIPTNEDVIVSFSLVTGDEIRVAENFIAESSLENSLWRLSGLVWRPDSSAFFLTMDRDACNAGDSAIVEASPSTGQIKVIYDFSGNYTSTLGWYEDGLIVQINNDLWILNPATGVLEPFE